jgi:hypothetical protein
MLKLIIIMKTPVENFPHIAQLDRAVYGKTYRNGKLDMNN